MSALDSKQKLQSMFLPLLVAIGMTVYFAVLFNITILPGILPIAIRSLVMPLVFAFPWFLFTLIFRERTINAWNTMKTKTGIIPLRWRMFYGFNTLIILSFFLFPFISPPLAVFAALVLAWRIVYHIPGIWEKSPGARLGYTIILFVILAILPCYFLIIWFQYYLLHIAAQILLIWAANVQNLYFISICIVNALTIGSLLLLSYGTLDQQGKIRVAKPTTRYIVYFIEIIVLGLLLFIYFDPLFLGFRFIDPLGIAPGSGLITYINYVGLVLFAMVFIAKLCVGTRGESRLSIVGLLLAAAFLLVELFNTFNAPLKELLILGSSLIFVVAFLISFFSASDEIKVVSELPSTDSAESQEVKQELEEADGESDTLS